MLNLHYQSYHAGQSQAPIVLLHGLFGSQANWGGVTRRLRDRWLIVPDLRNHGRSPHSDDVSYGAMAQDIIALLDRLNIPGACLVGHSMGGKLAMQLALRYPQRVTSLAVVDIAPVAYAHNFANIFAAFDSVDLSRIKTRAEARQQMDAGSLDGDTRAFLLQNLQKMTDQDKVSWRWRINLQALKANHDKITGYPKQSLAGYTQKTWFIHGERSHYVLPEHHPAILDAFPNAKFCPVAEAGHWVFFDQPERFMHCLHAFLQDETIARFTNI